MTGLRIRTALLLAAVLLLLCSFALAENPTPGKGTCGKPYCYWETPMDITDTEAVWNMLIQPMTIVPGKQRLREVIYARPDENAELVGEVTCSSMGVHVLENREDGWSLIECYSSSEGGSATKVYGDLVTGYIRTEKLQETDTLTKYGLVVDKLTQRMYVFQEGELITTLRISTGKPTEELPQNETTAGEFHLISMVGSYVAGFGIVCEHAIRFNDGCLIHNVPYQVNDEGEKDYWSFEKRLGQKASNGCIRVQRRRTPEGINMTWIWNRLFDQKRSRIVIWEDCPGRTLSEPPEGTQVYILPGGSGAYHRKPECYSTDRAYWPYQAIDYAQLEEEPYQGLANCYYCNPPLRPSRIEEINQAYAVEAAE